ncbi:hypothetical protein D3C73_1463650 [compost metagenome]
MPNLIPLLTVEIPVVSPSRAAGRTAAKNRRAALKGVLWPLAKASVILLGLFVKEAFL